MKDDLQIHLRATAFYVDLFVNFFKRKTENKKTRPKNEVVNSMSTFPVQQQFLE